MAFLFLFMLPSYTVQRIPCLLFICLFEEGSICMIYNEECSCSDFSSHPLPKLFFCSSGMYVMCRSLNLPRKCPQLVIFVPITAQNFLLSGLNLLIPNEDRCNKERIFFCCEKENPITSPNVTYRGDVALLCADTHLQHRRFL